MKRGYGVDMKTLKLKNKQKKVPEKQRLQKLLKEFTLTQKSSEERVARYEDLARRSSKDPQAEKHIRNIKRLEEARKLLEESLVFVNHVKQSLESLSEKQ
jgi:hypothetical protein